jgi:hypothetical protein
VKRKKKGSQQAGRQASIQTSIFKETLAANWDVHNLFQLLYDQGCQFSMFHIFASPASAKLVDDQRSDKMLTEFDIIPVLYKLEEPTKKLNLDLNGCLNLVKWQP